MKILVSDHDLPADFVAKSSVAIDTEAMGLHLGRDRLCLVQLSNGDGQVYLIKIHRKPQPAPRLKKILADESIEKIYHFARFDIAILYRTFGEMSRKNFCTKIASRLVRTYTERHGLREICRELLSVDLSKSEQSSDWGHDTLTESQKRYAANDVLYLHPLQRRLTELLKREDRYELFRHVCDALIARIALDCAGFYEDIFAHH